MLSFYNDLFALSTLVLSRPEAAALRLGRFVCPVAGDADVLCRTSVSFIIDTVGGFAAYLQLLLWCLEQVGERPALVLVVAPAAGITGLLCLRAFHDDLALAAAVV